MGFCTGAIGNESCAAAPHSTLAHLFPKALVHTAGRNAGSAARYPRRDDYGVAQREC
jgi:hypothetical protein